MTHSRPDSLFSEFPAVSRVAWKTKAIAELKEKPYDTIVWHTPDGFDLEPWHSHEENKLCLGIPTGKVANSWKNCHRIIVHDPESANKSALQCFELDAAALEFFITDPALCTAESLNQLLAGINTSAVAIHFSGNLPPAAELLKTLAAIPDGKLTSGGVLAETPAASKELDQELFSIAASLPAFRILSVDTIPFHDKGSTAVQEIALALAKVSDYLHRFLQAGIPVDRIV